MAPAERLYNQIMTLHNSRSFERAAQAAGAALEDAPNDARLWEMLGIARHALRDLPRAVEALETATLIAPLSPAAQVALADGYVRTNRCDVARSMYEHLASQRARIPTSLLAMVASGLARLQEPLLALEVCRERAYRTPEDEGAVYAVAHYMRLAQYPVELILPVAHRAFRLAPERIRNRVFLALMHYHDGDRIEAYRLVVPIPLEQLLAECCPYRLRRLAALFRHMQDDRRTRACESHVKRIREQGGARQP